MRRFLATLLVLVIGAFADNAHASAAQSNTLPAEVAQALASADRVELYSLEPMFAPGAKNTELWHGYILLGHTSLSAEKANAATAQFAAAVKGWDGLMAACFDPRHALRFESAGHSYDLLLCYECHALEAYRDGKLVANLGAAGSPAILNKLLAQAKVPLSQSAHD